MTSVALPGVPFPLEPSGNPPVRSVLADGVLTLTCGPESDLFIDPSGEGNRLDAGQLTGLPGDQDFTFAARVSVRFGAVFDAGVLLLYLSERRWAKLCYEFSPQRRPAAVTVVTHGTSDDSNSFETAGAPLWLRITRSGRAWAFHASEDGGWWRLLRYFTLGEASGARVGFLAQSPIGPGCTAIFDQIVYKPGAPSDLRDGSLSRAGGPVITTASDRLAMTAALNWKTMPEALLEAGVSWKVYNDPTGLLGLSVLPCFKNYDDPPGRRHRLPAARQQLDAVAGDHPGPSQRPVTNVEGCRTHGAEDRLWSAPRSWRA